MVKQWPIVFGEAHLNSEAASSATQPPKSFTSDKIRRTHSARHLAAAASSTLSGLSSMDTSAWTLSGDDDDGPSPSHPARSSATVLGAGSQRTRERRFNPSATQRRTATSHATHSHSVSRPSNPISTAVESNEKDRLLERVLHSSHVKCTVAFEIRNRSGAVVCRNRRLTVTVRIEEGSSVASSSSSGASTSGIGPSSVGGFVGFDSGSYAAVAALGGGGSRVGGFGMPRGNGGDLSSGVAQEAYLEVTVSDERRPRMVYRGVVSESEFEALKRDQKLLIAFREFPKYLIALLAECAAQFEDEDARSRDLAYGSGHTDDAGFNTGFPSSVISDMNEHESKLQTVPDSSGLAGGSHATGKTAATMTAGGASAFVSASSSSSSSSSSHSSKAGGPSHSSKMAHTSGPSVIAGSPANFIGVLTLLESIDHSSSDGIPNGGSGPSPSSSAMIGRVGLSVEERNDFRHLQHVCLFLDALNGPCLERYLAGMILGLRRERALVYESFGRVKKMHIREHRNFALLKTRSEEMKSKLEIELDQIKQNGMKETSKLSQQFSQEKEQLLERTNQERSEAIEQHRKQVQSLLAEKQALLDDANDLTSKLQLEQHNHHILSEEVAKLKDELLQIKDKKARLSEQHAHLDSKVSKLEKQRDQFRGRCDSLSDSLDEKIKLNESLTVNIAELKESLKATQKLLNHEQKKSHQCVKEINKGNQLIKNFTQVKRTLEAQNQVLFTQLNEMKQKYGVLDEKHNQLLNKDMIEKDGMITRLKSEVEQLNTTVDKKSKEMDEAKQLLFKNQQVMGFLNRKLSEYEKHFSLPSSHDHHNHHQHRHGLSSSVHSSGGHIGSSFRYRTGAAAAAAVGGGGSHSFEPTRVSAGVSRLLSSGVAPTSSASRSGFASTAAAAVSASAAAHSTAAGVGSLGSRKPSSVVSASFLPHLTSAPKSAYFQSSESLPNHAAAQSGAVNVESGNSGSLSAPLTGAAAN